MSRSGCEHIPSGWRLHVSKHNLPHLIFDEKGTLVAQVPDLANARMLTAALDLLAALKAAHRYLFTEHGPDEIDRGILATEMEAAIAKAEEA